MTELNQLILNFGLKKNFDKHDYYVSKSNFFAFNIIDKWPKWEKKFVNIFGDTFSGKTHLANIFKSKSNGLLIKSEEFTDDTLKQSKLHDTIIIDNFKNKS